LDAPPGYKRGKLNFLPGEHEVLLQKIIG